MNEEIKKWLKHHFIDEVEADNRLDFEIEHWVYGHFQGWVYPIIVTRYTLEPAIREMAAQLLIEPPKF